MNLYLQDKVILITDGGDFLVSLISRLLEEKGAIPCRIPLIDPEFCILQIQETIRHYGRIDGLVNTLAMREHIFLAYVITKAARPWLQASGGAIVNIMAAANNSSMGLTAAWASELLRQGIRVNGIIIREGQQPDIAETVAFLLSPAATALNGELV